MSFFLCRANIDEVETDVVEIEAKLDKVRSVRVSILFNRAVGFRLRNTGLTKVWCISVWMKRHRKCALS